VRILFARGEGVVSWTAENIPDQTGRVVVVTGANGGLGFETARALAGRGATVVMAARNLERAESARNDIAEEHPEARLEVRTLDLASLASVRRFAQDLVGDHDRVHVLVNNAGVMATPRRETEDGFELQFGTNHLGHFALTARLMPVLLRAPAARVVTVTSTARHYRAALDPDHPHVTRDYDPWRAYGRAKMANLHFAAELNRRLVEAGAFVASLAAHPGYANTDLQAQSARSHGGVGQRFFATTVQWMGMSAADGALPQLRAATDPGARGGELYTPRWVNSGPPVRRPIMSRSQDPGEMGRLWEVSERETGIVFDVAELVARNDSA
jgi:NAD(P)-dependent dehydrogenase (short-subunit alcohol dehydrogenase family)